MPGMTTDHARRPGGPERSGPRFAVTAGSFPVQGPVALLPIFMFRQRVTVAHLLSILLFRFLVLHTGVVVLVVVVWRWGAGGVVGG